MNWLAVMSTLALVICFYKLDTILCYDCYKSYECGLSSVTETNGSDVNCYGWNSCRQASQIKQTGFGLSLDIYVNCHGGYSCFKADSIEAIGGFQWRKVACYGAYSCAFVDKIQMTDGIQCYGQMSCFGSNIYTNDSSASFSCLAFGACSYSIIQTLNGGTCGGYLSCQNAVIILGDTNGM